MATTLFVDGVTKIQAHWLNDVNNFLYTTFQGLTSSNDIREMLHAVSDEGDSMVGNYDITGNVEIDGDLVVTGTLTVDAISLEASAIPYDDTVTQLGASNVQEAIESVSSTNNSQDGAILVLQGQVSGLQGDVGDNSSDITDLQNNKEDVGVASGLMTSHTNAANPHPQYILQASGVDADNVSYDNSVSNLSATDVQAAIDELSVAPPISDIDAVDVDYDNSTSGLAATDVQAAIDELVVSSGGVISVNGRSGAVTLSSTDVGLGNVDNTSDANKPISTATQSALNGKADLTDLNDYLLIANNLSDLGNAGTARTNLGLGNVNNTSDANKPISSATQAALDSKSPLYTPVRNVTASFTLGLSDHSYFITCNSGATITVTVPTNASVAFPVGSYVMFQQTGAGQVSLSAAGGVTLVSPSSLTSAEQGSSIGVIKTATNTWAVTGDLT